MLAPKAMKFVERSTHVYCRQTVAVNEVEIILGSPLSFLTAPEEQPAAACLSLTRETDHYFPSQPSSKQVYSKVALGAQQLEFPKDVETCGGQADNAGIVRPRRRARRRELSPRTRLFTEPHVISCRLGNSKELLSQNLREECMSWCDLVSVCPSTYFLLQA